MNEEFNVKIETLFINNLSFEGYFILWCLNYKDETKLLSYVKNCRKIPTEIFRLLESKGYISISKELQDDKITYSSLKLLDQGKRLFNVQDFETLFNELRECYPKEAGKSGRKLHLDLKRCRALYKKIIGNDLDLHELICKCAKLYHTEKIRSNSEDYMQLLATWLHQQNYEQYIDEARKISLIKEEGVQSEDI